MHVDQALTSVLPDAVDTLRLMLFVSTACGAATYAASSKSAVLKWPSTVVFGATKVATVTFAGTATAGGIATAGVFSISTVCCRDLCGRPWHGT